MRELNELLIDFNIIIKYNLIISPKGAKLSAFLRQSLLISKVLGPNICFE